MVGLDIEGYMISLMCWIFAVEMRISYTWDVNISYKSDFIMLMRLFIAALW